MSPGPPPFGPALQRVHRGRALVVLGVAAMLVHALFLAGLEWTWPALPSRPAVLRVRTVDAAPSATPVTPAPATAFEEKVDAPVLPPVDEAGRGGVGAVKPRFVRTPASMLQPRAVAQTVRPGGGKVAAPVAAAPVLAIATPEVPAREPPQAPAEPMPLASAAPLSPPTDEPIPLYRTRMPPAATLHYALRRGAQLGSAALQWQPTAEGYAMRFDGSLAGVPVISQVSVGTFDIAGLAPARYTDRRQRRQMLAVNFRRDAGKVSFSGSSDDFPLQRGTQDRLTWMLQLAAVLAAEPARREPGARVAVPVAGVRGEPVVWFFHTVGMDEVSTEAGALSALKLVRASSGLYDPTVEVWLDPDRHYLPLRTLLRNGADSQTFELVLERLEITR